MARRAREIRASLYPYRVDGVHNLAVGCTIGTLLNLAVIHFQQVIEPGEELVLAHKECRIHHSDVRHGCCVCWTFVGLRLRRRFRICRCGQRSNLKNDRKLSRQRTSELFFWQRREGLSPCDRLHWRYCPSLRAI